MTLFYTVHMKAFWVSYILLLQNTKYGSHNVYLCLECSFTLRPPSLHPLSQNKKERTKKWIGLYTLHTAWLETAVVMKKRRTVTWCINMTSQHTRKSKRISVYQPFYQSSMQNWCWWWILQNVLFSNLTLALLSSSDWLFDFTRSLKMTVQIIWTWQRLTWMEAFSGKMIKCKHLNDLQLWIKGEKYQF